MSKKYRIEWASWGGCISFFVWIFCVLLGCGLWRYWGYPCLRGMIFVFLFFTAGWFGYLSEYPKLKSKDVIDW